MNDIRSITNLNRTSKEWMTGSKGGFDSLWGSLTSNLRSRVLEQEKRSKEWKQMGLNRNDASDVICFRHWYNFYVSGKKNMNGWVAEFNSAHYRNFIQLYEPGDYFKHPGVLTARKDKLRLSQEKQDYYAILQKATKAGDVSKEQRYHLLQYMERQEKMSIIDDIKSQRDEGLRLGVKTPQENRLKELLHRDEVKDDERVKNDLLFYQQFCQFFFSAFLVLVYWRLGRGQLHT